MSYDVFSDGWIGSKIESCAHDWEIRRDATDFLTCKGCGVQVELWKGLNRLLSVLQNGAFPVNSIFISAVATDPNTLLGYGTWSRQGQGRVIVGVDENDADFNSAGKTGGAKTHTLTVNEIPAHSHTYASQTATTGSVASYEHGAIDASSTANESSIGTNQTGGGQPHQNMPPFITAYIWRRTA